MKSKSFVLTVYVLAAAFTYGYACDQELKWRTKCFPYLLDNNEDMAEQIGLAAAIVWPIYWPFHLSAELWKSGKSGESQQHD